MKLVSNFRSFFAIAALATASAIAVGSGGTLTAIAAPPYPTQLVSYDPGSGFVPGFTDPYAALGEPSHTNPFGEPTDPFNPPYGTQQLVSIGTRGSLILKFQTPVLNHPLNIHGMDFLVFGNSGFVITNEFDFDTFNWIGIPSTDGSMFGASNGDTLVSVSRDGTHFYLLDPTLAPPLDNFPPTDGAGDPQLPIPPNHIPSDFTGATLHDIRDLYAGSAGGAAYDISWAIDENGHSVFLPAIRFVRIDVLSGKAEVDAVTKVARQSEPVGHRQGQRN